MIRVCAECKIQYGEKAPFEDKSLTHGLCRECFEKALRKIEKFEKERRNFMSLGVMNKRAIQGTQRPAYKIEMGEEFVIKSSSRSFIIRGARDSLWISSIGYLGSRAEDLFAGTTNGIVRGKSFSVGYQKDVVKASDIPTIDI